MATQDASADAARDGCFATIALVPVGGPDERVRVEARARVDPHRLILASPLSPREV